MIRFACISRKSGRCHCSIPIAKTWLSSQIAAQRLYENILDELAQDAAEEGESEAARVAERAYAVVLQNWDDAVRQSAQYKVRPLEFTGILREVQALAEGFEQKNSICVTTCASAIEETTRGTSLLARCSPLPKA
ncbi:MAG: hypothetical protein U0452_06960 [Anaerolineae bacterium]